MNKKHFVFGFDQKLSKESVNKIREDNELLLLEGDKGFSEKSKSKLQEEDFLNHVEGRVVVKVDMKSKNNHTFGDGTVIRLEREFNNFNRCYTQPVNAIVISGEGIPKDAELLVDHNAFHETNRINDYKNHFESEDSERVRYFSLPRYECYCWRIGDGDWTPIYPFEFALRVFKPYAGSLVGIEPTKLTDTLFVTSGELKGKVVKTLKGCDYQITYQSSSGKEDYLICFRPEGDEKRKMESEAIAILHDLTDEVNEGDLLVGYSLSDCKPLKELIHA